MNIPQGWFTVNETTTFHLLLSVRIRAVCIVPAPNNVFLYKNVPTHVLKYLNVPGVGNYTQKKLIRSNGKQGNGYCAIMH